MLPMSAECGSCRGHPPPSSHTVPPLKVLGRMPGAVVVSLQDVSSGSGDLNLSCSQVLPILPPEYLESDWGGGLDLPLGGVGEPVLGLAKLSSLMPLLAEWTQRDLERMENIRFCRQYLVFHDGDSVVFAGPAGNSVETRGE